MKRKLCLCPQLHFGRELQCLCVAAFDHLREISHRLTPPPKNLPSRAKQTNPTRNQHYRISNGHLHLADTAAMPKAVPAGRRAQTHIPRGSCETLTGGFLSRPTEGYDTAPQRLGADPPMRRLGSCLELPFSSKKFLRGMEACVAPRSLFVNVVTF